MIFSKNFRDKKSLTLELNKLAESNLVGLDIKKFLVSNVS